MAIETIKSLKSTLADLTYILYVIGKEIELIIEHSEDEKANEELFKTTSILQDSNNSVIRLYHEIDTHETEIKNEWYDDKTKVESLQHEVDKLKEAISVIIEGNKDLLNFNK